MICVVCLFAFSSNNYVKAASTTVRGAYTVCQGQEEWYTIDNDYTTGQEWWVEGGEIIEYSFFGDAHTDQRYPNYWNFWATGSQVVCFPFVACQDYANEANRGDLRPSRIKIRWTGQGQGIVKCRARDYGWMSTQHAYDEKVITIYGTPTTQQINSFYLTGNANPNCDQYTSIRPVNLPEYYGANYTWNVPTEAEEDGKNKYNLNIKGYNMLTGFRNVSYTISPANGCGGTITKSFGLNIQPKKAGPLLDNNNSEIITDANGAVVKSLIPNTSSQINLRFQNSINGASYLWRVPRGFNTNGTYTNGFVQTSSGQYAGNMPSNALIDYSGEVTVIGYCGTQVYPFTVKARQAVTVPENLESCGCVVDISINNPNYDNVYSAWEQTGKGGTVSVINNETVRFTAPTDGNGGCKADKYTVGMSIAGVNGNKITNITIGGNTAKWLSGTLSDVRKNVSSNLVYTADQRIFFSARDGKLYYYEFDKSVNKWVSLQYAPSVTTAKNVAGDFVNIAARSTNGYTEVFYTNATDNFVWKSVNGNNSQQIQGTQNATSIYLDKRSSNPYRNTLLCRISDGSLVTVAPNAISATSTGISNVDNSALLGHGGNIYFVRNQELYRAPYTNGASQTKISGTFKLHPKTSFDFDGDGRLYVCEASGKMLRINLSTLLIETVVTTAGFCDGEFAINPTANNALNIAIVYAKHKVGGQANYTMWKAYPGFTGGLPYIADPATASTFDYVAHSPIYVYPHVYYIAETTPEGVNSVWNLYFKENCTPAIFRKGDTEVATSNTISTGIKIYPNPMGNMLYVEANGAERAELWNTLGTKVSSFNLENGQANLNTEQLSSGVYILNLFAGDGLVATQKLIK